MVQAQIGEIIDECPVIKIEDLTDYSPVESIATYKIHDYLSSVPAINSSFVITDITIDGDDVLGGAITVLTDPSGNLYDPTLYYTDIVSQINGSTPDFGARLIIPSNTATFREWYVEIFAYGALNNGKVLASNTDPGITPLMTNFTGGTDLDYRNISIYGPRDCYLDLGGTAQKDAFIFNHANYAVGSVITFDICGQEIAYTVTDRNTRDCIIADLVKILNETEDNYCGLIFTEASGSIEVLASEVGTPFFITVSYSLIPVIDYISKVNLEANQTNWKLPNTEDENIFAYEPNDKGGKHVVTLTIGSGCDKSVVRKEYYNWCFDKQSFDCCFNALALKVSCGKDDITKAANLRNIIRAIDVMEEEGRDPVDIQKAVDYGWSICEPLDCCKSNRRSKIVVTNSNTGDCGCG
jgi:hypothetical protein